VTGLGAFAGPATIDEDCLYLNVFGTGKPFFGGLKHRLDSRRRKR
jgi:hypothetical protein